MKDKNTRAQLFRSLAFGLLFVLGQTLPAQQQHLPGIAWKKTFGEKGTQKSVDVLATFDGNIAVLGSTDGQKEDALWVLVDRNGNLIRQEVIGLRGDDHAAAMTQTFDGGFLIVGHTESTPDGKQQPWMAKISERGDTLWHKIIAQPGKAAFADVIQASTGELVLTGYTEKPDGNRDIWVSSFYEDGTLRWQRTYGEGSEDEGRKIVETEDGQFAVAGITSSGKGGRNLWLFLLDRDGTPRQYRIFGSRQWEDLGDLIHTSDGGFAITGTAKTNNQNKGKGLRDTWLIKTAPDGEQKWQTTFGGANNDGANGVTETADGGFVMVGFTFSHIIGANTSSALLVKADSNGKMVWYEDKTFGGKDNDVLTGIVTMQDGSMVVIGNTSSKAEGAKGEDVWLIHLHPEAYISHRKPTKIVIRDFVLQENGDQVLEEGEKGYLKITLENKGTENAFDIELAVGEKTGITNLKYRDYQKIAVLRAGRSKTVYVPIEGTAGLKTGDAIMTTFCTDISRSRSPESEIVVPVKPLELPSNFLDVVWLDPNPVEFGDYVKTVQTKDFGIKIKARSDRELLRKHFTILVNGQPTRVGAKAGEVNLKNLGKAKNVFMYEYANRVGLSPGENIIEIEADNGSRKVRSRPFKIILSTKPSLHLLAVGIGHDDLNFTKKDARDFAASFNGQAGGVYEKVYVTTLISGELNQAGVVQTNGEVIKKAFADMRDNYNYTIYEQDLLVVFISSHGKTIRGEFKIVPSDFDLVGEDALVDYRRDVVKPLDALPCQKLLFIDACHSGSAEEGRVGANITSKPGGDERSTTLAATNAESKSVNMLASCRANESSWEDASWNNGAFTKAVLAAFQNEPFSDHNGEFVPTEDDSQLTVGELFNYISRRVPQMVKNAQKDGTQRPYIDNKQLEILAKRAIFETGKTF